MCITETELDCLCYYNDVSSCNNSLILSVPKRNCNDRTTSSRLNGTTVKTKIIIDVTKAATTKTTHTHTKQKPVHKSLTHSNCAYDVSF